MDNPEKDNLEEDNPEKESMEGNSHKTGNIEDLIEAWWSRYCPDCGTRHPMSETHCPHDGTSLRDLSIARAWISASTGSIPSTGELFGAVSHCPKCGASAEPGALVCPQDGTPLCPEPPPDALLASPPPAALGGKWLLLNRRGGGAFGAFYSGKHISLGMKVGVKILKRRFTTSAAGRRLFHQEAMRVSLLNHPNIVKVFDYGDEEDTPYLVMEYLNGQPLHRYIAEGGLSLEDGVEVIRQAAVALIAAHGGKDTGAPLVHLDLKPEHIFLEKIQGRWHVKVIDFGIAEIVSAPRESDDGLDPQKAPKRIAGTFPYMAPERWRGAVDPRCDLYSLGIILYELVAGRKPFEAPDPEVWRRLHESEIPPPPSRSLGKRTPLLKELDAIILWTLKKNPEERPENAEALVAAIENWQAKPQPRLSKKQQILRAARVLALTAVFTAVLALPLLYWAPWEKVVLPSSSDSIALGPKNSWKIYAKIAGFGYEEGAVRLRVVQGERPGVIFLKETIREGQLKAEASWEDFQRAKIDPSECKAEVIVIGWLWRQVRSGPLTIVLDAQPPALVSIAGGGERDAGTTLNLLENDQREEHLLQLAASEPLDVSKCECFLENKTQVPILAEKDKSSISLTVPREAQKLRVKLVDLAGNILEKEWTIQRIRMVEILPNSGELELKDGKTLITARWIAGPEIQEILVNGERAQEVGHGVWEQPVSIQPVNQTTVEILVKLANDGSQTHSRVYSSAPDEEKRYLFDLGPLGQLELEFFKTSRANEELQGFWFSSTDVAKDLLRRFLSFETHAKKNPINGDAEVRWQDAADVVDWVTQELINLGKIGADQGARLPLPSQWRALVERGRIRRASDSPALEWLSDEEESELISLWPVLGGCWNQEGRAIQQGFKRAEEVKNSGFRLILPYGGKGNQLIPKAALSARPLMEKGGN
ncbi:MAG: protein kinase [Planctomycetes bacterium]|nr:protein kinase [Planctomycetota bacterium]